MSRMRRVLPGLAVVLAVTALTSCSLSSPEPRRDQIDNPTARAQATEAGRVTDNVLRRTLGDTTPLLVGELDACEQGQNNWKAHQGYLWRCAAAAGAVVDAGQVEQGLREQERAVLAQGCSAYYNETQQVTQDAEWLITRYLRERLDDRPSGLPSLRYTCPNGVVVHLDPSDRQDLDVIADPAAARSVDRDEDFVHEAPTVLDVIRVRDGSAGPLLLRITVAQQYLEVPV